jgi:alpha-tubulin suppressor-like RCC1 family protein
MHQPLRHITHHHDTTYAIDIDRTLHTVTPPTTSPPERTWETTGLRNIAAVTIGAGHDAAVTTDGHLHSLQRHPDNNHRSSAWTELDLDNVTDIAIHDHLLYALTSDGTLHTTDLRTTTTRRWSVTRHNTTAVSSGRHLTLIISNGDVYGIGQGHTGALGPGNTRGVTTWTHTGISNITQVRAGDISSFAITSDGKLYGCGTLPTIHANNRHTHSNQYNWTALSAHLPHPVVDVITGNITGPHLILTDNGNLYRLDSIPTDGTTSVLTDLGLPNVISAAASWNSIAAIDRDGRLHLIGTDNDCHYGYPGLNTTSWVTIPDTEPANRTFATLVADGVDAHTAAATAHALHTLDTSVLH